jgi:hypothetical protein
VAKVVCNLRRRGGTKIEFGGKRYHFLPEDVDPSRPDDWPLDAPHVCEIKDAACLKRLAAPAMNGAYHVPGVSPDEEKAAELTFTEPDTADTLEGAVAKVGEKLLEGGEYAGREDYVAAQMSSFYGAEKKDIIEKLGKSKTVAAAEKARKEAEKKGKK